MNILIIKIGAMGDVLRSSFIAQALKEKYSLLNPKVFWISDEKANAIFFNNPYVDHFVKEKNKSKISRIKFDLILNLEEDLENCIFASSLKHHKFIGFYHKNGKILPTPEIKEWFNMSMLGKKPENDVLKKNNRKTHKQIMSEIIGVDYKKYEPFLRLNKKQRKIAENFLRKNNLTRKDFIIGLNTGAADRWPKSLPIKEVVKLIEQISKRFEAKILLFGGPNEVERNAQIIKLSNVPIIDTGCENDLYEFPALLSACSLVISSDSLGLHISLALKRKTICLVGPTSPYELDMYDLGEKVIANSNCVSCYRKDCKSMNKINLDKIIENVSKLTERKIGFIITSFKEPNMKRAIEHGLSQNTNIKYDLIISAPDEETLNMARKYSKKNKNIKIFKDPGKGKSYALNALFEKLEYDILILTDGDVYVNNLAVEEIISLFDNPEIGCVTGRPYPIEDRNNKYGYWAHFLFDAAHKIRKDYFEKNKFIECSGYLFAFRKNKIDKIPLDVAEDTVIPYFFWEKGYMIGYAENALVYVKNVDNLKDWMNQKTRTSKAHETLDKYAYVNYTPRVKTFLNEISLGAKMLIKHPSNLRETFWVSELSLVRFFMWAKVYFDTKLRNKNYGDAWERIDSAR